MHHHLLVDFSGDTDCKVTNETYLGIQECYCSSEPGPDRCKSHFPCYQVIVSYHTADGSKEVGNLYEDINSFHHRTDKNLKVIS